MASRSPKELLRNFSPAIFNVAKRVYFSILSVVRRRTPHELMFTKIYRKGGWGIDETLSGVGSTLEHTATLRRALPDLFAKSDVKSILDIPCGDFNWMQHVDLSGIEYTGADIVEDLVRRNHHRFAREGVRFLHLDVVK